MVSQFEVDLISSLSLCKNIRIPSERTLRDYSNHIQTNTDFQKEVLEQLRKEVKIEKLSEAKKHVSLLVDEMSVEESLVYDKFSGKLVGFIDLGSITNDVIIEKELAGKCNSTKCHRPIADHILVLMVHGIFIRLNFPLAHFPSKNLNCTHLFRKAFSCLRVLGSKSSVL